MKLLMFLVIIFLCLIVWAGCKRMFFKDEKLTLSKKEYLGNELQLEGYFLNEYSTKNEDYIEVFFFYRNGIMSDMGVFPNTELSSKELYFNSPNNNAFLKKSKLAWGLFQISDGQIEYEKWYPSEPPMKVYIKSGIIINDTTFIITSSRNSHGKEKRKIENTIFHFKKFDPKPDSTNTFI
jgi:hypothetical protein